LKHILHHYDGSGCADCKRSTPNYGKQKQYPEQGFNFILIIKISEIESPIKCAWGIRCFILQDIETMHQFNAGTLTSEHIDHSKLQIYIIISSQKQKQKQTYK